MIVRLPDETWSSKNISELKKHELLKELKVKYDLMLLVIIVF